MNTDQTTPLHTYQVKVSDLTPPQMDWVIGRILGYSVCLSDEGFREGLRECFFLAPVLREETFGLNEYDKKIHSAGDPWSPSTLFQHGGPLIDSETISVDGDTARAPHVKWRAVMTSKLKDSWNLTQRTSAHGPTMLIAAMRCFIQAHHGDTVETQFDKAAHQKYLNEGKL